jgi:hypothetical protein
MRFAKSADTLRRVAPTILAERMECGSLLPLSNRQSLLESGGKPRALQTLCEIRQSRRHPHH